MIYNALHNLVACVVVMASLCVIAAFARPAQPVARDQASRVENLEMLLLHVDVHIDTAIRELRDGRNPRDVADSLEKSSGCIHLRFIPMDGD
jgi:hypothetical protein